MAEAYIDRLKRKFQLQLKPYETRKIIFWFDDEGVAKDELDQLRRALSDESVILLELNNNAFEAKVQLERTDASSHYLVYSTEKKPDDEANWLLDTMLYSTIFSVGRLETIKEHIGIESTVLDECIATHTDFFNSKERIEHVKKLYAPEWREKDLLCAMIGYCVKTKTCDISEAVLSLLSASLDEGENTYWKELDKFGLVEPFWHLVTSQLSSSVQDPTLEKLYFSLFVTSVYHRTSIQIPEQYGRYINANLHINETLIHKWADSKEYGQSFDAICRSYEEKNKDIIKEVLADCPLEEYVKLDFFPFIDQTVIIRLIQATISASLPRAVVRSHLSKRKEMHWKEDYVHIYQALDAATRLLDEREKKLSGLSTLDDCVVFYGRDYYKIDQLYRQYYEHALQAPNKEVLRDLTSRVESIYTSHCQEGLFPLWDSLLESQATTQGNVIRQEEFYQRVVSGHDTKLVVIISDALRYEVGAELADTLNSSLNGDAVLSPMVASLPTTTSIGMASLLPHKTLSYDGKSVKVDGLPCASTEERDAILSKRGECRAIRYQDVDAMSRADAREFFKHKLVYIYHNSIDAVGDTYSTEHKVFLEARQAIDELSLLVKRLVNECNVTSVAIVADHGFIFTPDYTKEMDRLPPLAIDTPLASNKRYVVATERHTFENVHTLPLRYEGGQLYLYTPYRDYRFPHSGPGYRYVHGGASPLEMIVPLIRYTHVRVTDKAAKRLHKVGLAIVNQSRTITTNLASILLYQTEPVGDKVTPITVRVMLWDDDSKKPVSDEKTLTFDTKSNDTTERQQKVVLTLRNDVANKRYRLRVVDTDPKAMLSEILSEYYDVNLTIQHDFW